SHTRSSAVSPTIDRAGIRLASASWFRAAFHGATARSRAVRSGHTLLVNKYYFDHLYTGIIATGTSGPIARAADWFNQNVIDSVVNGVGAGSQLVARWTYRYVDQDAIDGAINGSGAGAEGSGQLLRKLQSGRVQQYGALLFGG